MSAWKSGFGAIMVVAVLSDSVQAQKSPVYPGTGVNTGYYTTSSGYGNYGLPGAYPYYSGYGFSGYGPGANLGAYFSDSRSPNAPMTYNNMGGLMNTIRQQTGRSKSDRAGSRFGTSRNGRMR